MSPGVAGEGDRVDQGTGQSQQKRSRAPAPVGLPAGDGVEAGDRRGDDRVKAEIDRGEDHEDRIGREQGVGRDEGDTQETKPAELHQRQYQTQGDVRDVDGVGAEAEDEGGRFEGEDEEDGAQGHVHDWDGVSRPAASSRRYGAETGAPVVGRRQVRR